MANSNISFLGSLSWDEIEKCLDKTRALIFPGEEDFGMIPLEVMAYGIPVLAFKRGGALETVVENKNINESSGGFFEEQTPFSIQKCIDIFELNETKYDSDWIRGHARKFGEDQFLKRFSSHVNSIVSSNQ